MEGFDLSRTIVPVITVFIKIAKTIHFIAISSFSHAFYKLRKNLLSFASENSFYKTIFIQEPFVFSQELRATKYNPDTRDKGVYPGEYLHCKRMVEQPKCRKDYIGGVFNCSLGKPTDSHFKAAAQNFP
ncbi:hypothetical protein SDC9_127804 [bioreactor metagenome]|uniref:Uncharacterized protein n=1 Tax=bioreactor metagenome TaxID=1076179 RepID=A0A645CV31_9ZZZZ